MSKNKIFYLLKFDVIFTFYSSKTNYPGMSTYQKGLTLTPATTQKFIKINVINILMKILTLYYIMHYKSKVVIFSNEICVFIISENLTCASKRLCD